MRQPRSTWDTSPEAHCLGRAPWVDRDPDRTGEVIPGAQRQDSEAVVGTGQVTGHRPDGAVATGDDHESGLTGCVSQQVGQPSHVLDGKLLSHLDPVTIERSPRPPESATVARMRAEHQHRLGAGLRSA